MSRGQPTMGKRKIESKRGKRISTEEKKTKIKKNKEKYDKKKDIEAKRERKRLKKAEKARLKAEKEAASVDSKKRKREDESESQVAKPPKKKASKTGFPDPIRDKKLPKQARKVLVYVFERYDQPNRWKFNKSRQNWLIRNVWNSQSITDTHMPLALKYLSSLQGYARENLLKKCTSILEAPQTVEPTTEEAASTSTNKNAKIRAERARAIFDAISAANPVEDVEKKDKSMDDEEDSDASDSDSASSKSSSSESSSE